MTQEEKELLLKDLCGRLPYGVQVLVNDTFEYSTMPYKNVYLKSSDMLSLINPISLNERYNSKDIQFNRIIKEHKDFLEFKPYLRPMSSMTEEENRVYLSKCKYGNIQFPTLETFEYLYSIHIDYRGLIEKSLAIEVTEENNPYKE